MESAWAILTEKCFSKERCFCPLLEGDGNEYKQSRGALSMLKELSVSFTAIHVCSLPEECGRE